MKTNKPNQIIASILFLIIIVTFHSCIESERKAKKRTANTEHHWIDRNNNQILDPFENPKLSAEARAINLLNHMTIEEKAGQMTQISINALFAGTEKYKPDFPLSLSKDSLAKFVIETGCGSVFGCSRAPLTLEQYRFFITQIQDAAMQSRLKIPVLYGIDAIHGGSFVKESTIFPNQLGQAATWNPELVKQIASATAYETRAAYIPWNFSPVLGLGRQPLWSRFSETYGEDVFLTTIMGNAAIIGYEGDSLNDPEKVAACMKHFVGYSFPLSGKDRTQAWIPARMLREYFLPPFQAAINAGVHTCMLNSGEINGIPVHANHHLIEGGLRSEFGFEGLVVTDFKDIILLHENHRIVSSYKEAVKVAINAGVDMSMTPFDIEFTKYVIELSNSGEIPLHRLNKAVKRILKLKFELGLFEFPISDASNYVKFASEEFRQLSYKAATESITLLKNNGILPLSSQNKLLITGPTANSMIYLNGPWTYTWQGNDSKFDPKEKNTIFEAFENLNKENIAFIEGCSISKDINCSSAVRKAKNKDAVIICIGEEPAVEEPGNTNDLLISKTQKELVKAIAQTGTPIILVINSGRPIIITEIEALVDAIIFAYYPGNEGGNAIAQTIYGTNNPSGRLPFSYPKYTGSILSAYDHKHTDFNIEGEIKGYNPLYEFGHGLTYTTFSYSDLKIDKESLLEFDDLNITVEITNTGNRKGSEVVQLYIRDLYASVTPSEKRLRGFTKIELKAGETQTVNFKIPRNDLGFIGLDNEWVVEKGEFEIQLNTLKQRFFIE
ncbi:MAG: glycoside hydrolase family 3 C-terminal domain-containing protein [Bacteroidales bacterium]|nr:glycoside hydrolase family 3 C-terminal domain-containing protein [Bacteroidales bacterium]